MAEVDDQLHEFENAQKTAEFLAVGLRVDLAAIIMRGIKARGWTQKRLAEAVGMRESQISKLINGDANWETSTAARVLFALGVKARLVEQT